MDDFLKAVKRTKGMDWLGEWDLDDIPCDDDFFNEKNKIALLTGRLFLVVSNRKAINQLLSLWARFQNDPDGAFPKGRTKWRDVFQRLKTIRKWGVQDRLRESGLIEQWMEDLPYRQGSIRFEAELFYRNDIIKQGRAFRKFETVVKSEGGRCMYQLVHPQTSYHGVLVELPIASVAAVLDRHSKGEVTEVRLFTSEEVMFFRPVGQSSVRKPSQNEDVVVGNIETDIPLPSGVPLVGMFDGMPLENHPLLQGRLRVHDPAGWGEGYLAAHRRHATGMASLVTLGELGNGVQPLSRPVYVRPILKLDVSQPNNPFEQMPDDILAADLTFQAIKAMHDGNDNESPAAPEVRIVNMSVGDRARQFDGFMSPWARMLDWLSWKYKILFLVSAGNHTRPIEIDMSMKDFDALAPEDAEAVFLKALAGDIRNRRLLAPAESLNSMTVGAIHADGSNATALGYRKNPYLHALPAPYSALGFGYRHALKPEIWLPGGRQFYAVHSLSGNGAISLRGLDFLSEPGQCVAGPNGQPGEKAPICFTRGTSNATALGSHHAGVICEKLLLLRSETHGEIIEDDYLALFVKALLAHGATWSEAYEVLKKTLKGTREETDFNRQVGRFLGFGVPDCERVLKNTYSRATMLGRGTLKDGKAQKFTIPLPPSLSGKKVWQRLAVTLAWFSPINAQHRNYRAACLWFTNPCGSLKLIRQDADWQAVMRGTLQHEVFESDKASAFKEDEVIQIQVNCRADAGLLKDSVPYAVAITLEVADGSGIPVFDEVRARLNAIIGVPQNV
ncbi:MAG: hypothetical protein JWN24_4430 [Phycisphaerales bacterium]|nr:hypothetical protein [Phycisphaerales bacterium]